MDKTRLVGSPGFIVGAENPTLIVVAAVTGAVTVVEELAQAAVKQLEPAVGGDAPPGGSTEA